MTAITTAEAATRAHVTTQTVRTWCRNGAVAASKVGNRWAIDARSLGQRIRAGFRRPMDRLRKGERQAPLAGRPARRAAARVEARQVAAEHHTRVIGHHQRARIAAANSGRYLARNFLNLLGFPAEFIAKYESAFGRATAKLYRETHHAEPDNGGLVILRGRLWRCMRYTDAQDLIAGVRVYKRTAELLSA